MNTWSISKYSIKYQFILFIATSLFIFSACGDKTDETSKLDYVSLMTGDYTGELDFGIDASGQNTILLSTATVSAGSVADEVTFTYKITQSDSTISFKIQLQDLKSSEGKGIALRIPEQTVNSVQLAGIALNEPDVRGRQGFFYYTDKDGEIINQIRFKITADGLTTVFSFEKPE